MDQKNEDPNNQATLVNPEIDDFDLQEPGSQQQQPPTNSLVYVIITWLILFLYLIHFIQSMDSHINEFNYFHPISNINDNYEFIVNSINIYENGSNYINDVFINCGFNQLQYSFNFTYYDQNNINIYNNINSNYEFIDLINFNLYLLSPRKRHISDIDNDKDNEDIKEYSPEIDDSPTKKKRRISKSLSINAEMTNLHLNGNNDETVNDKIDERVNNKNDQTVNEQRINLTNINEESNGINISSNININAENENQSQMQKQESEMPALLNNDPMLQAFHASSNPNERSQKSSSTMVNNRNYPSQTRIPFKASSNPRPKPSNSSITNTKSSKTNVTSVKIINILNGFKSDITKKIINATKVINDISTQVTANTQTLETLTVKVNQIHKKCENMESQTRDIPTIKEATVYLGQATSNLAKNQKSAIAELNKHHTHHQYLNNNLLNERRVLEAISTSLNVDISHITAVDDDIYEIKDNQNNDEFYENGFNSNNNNFNINNNNDIGNDPPLSNSNIVTNNNNHSNAFMGAFTNNSMNINGASPDLVITGAAHRSSVPASIPPRIGSDIITQHTIQYVGTPHTGGDAFPNKNFSLKVEGAAARFTIVSNVITDAVWETLGASMAANDEGIVLTGSGTRMPATNQSDIVRIGFRRATVISEELSNTDENGRTTRVNLEAMDENQTLNTLFNMVNQGCSKLWQNEFINNGIFREFNAGLGISILRSKKGWFIFEDKSKAQPINCLQGRIRFPKLSTIKWYLLTSEYYLKSHIVALIAGGVTSGVIFIGTRNSIIKNNSNKRNNNNVNRSVAEWDFVRIAFKNHLVLLMPAEIMSHVKIMWLGLTPKYRATPFMFILGNMPCYNENAYQ